MDIRRAAVWAMRWRANDFKIIAGIRTLPPRRNIVHGPLILNVGEPAT